MWPQKLTSNMFEPHYVKLFFMNLWSVQLFDFGIWLSECLCSSDSLNKTEYCIERMRLDLDHKFSGHLWQGGLIIGVQCQLMICRRHIWVQRNLMQIILISWIFLAKVLIPVGLTEFSYVFKMVKIWWNIIPKPKVSDQVKLSKLSWCCQIWGCLTFYSLLKPILNLFWCNTYHFKT